jgi:molecular chaperone DnaJ
VFQDLGYYGVGGGLFEEIFSDLGFDIFGTGGRRGSAARRRGRDLQIAVGITLEEAATGTKKTINVPRYETCSTCGGSGAKPGTKKTTCSQCKGAGRTVVSNGYFQMAQTCPRCRGEGSVIQSPCQDCRGEGKTKVSRKIEVKIPAGVDTGSNLRIRGEGEAGSAGKGDLYVIIEVSPHRNFERHGNDIVTEVSISLVKAILGSEIDVPTLGGHAKMRIPAGTQSGRVFRMKNMGLPDLHGSGNGDELVKINVKIPENLSNQQKKVIEEFARLSGEDISIGSSFSEKIKKAFK